MGRIIGGIMAKRIKKKGIPNPGTKKDRRLKNNKCKRKKKK